MLVRHWHKLGLELDSDDFTDAQAVAAVDRITSGSFRLLQRLFAQIHRVMKINELHTATADVVETARSTLVIGATWRCKNTVIVRCESQPSWRFVDVRSRLHGCRKSYARKSWCGTA